MTYSTETYTENTKLKVNPTVTPAAAEPASTSAQAASSNTVSVSADHLRAHLDSHLEKVPVDSEFARLIAKFKDTLADIENFIHTEVLPKL